ncbi:MAG: RsbRD N-terminal domain-containing protein [Polaromonas sp.]|uniref:RsbRD N-terminal domain-containing protein n=1 Tax=Polaromonas sp. TaxID=1869339 RepID=UPI002734A253|nr:RsbRD N-terminal domain-containing protein [Polaromonas sp.]MDP3799632.1 RsbRD N-terminal domain-containing protein [Polaromonas sp.]
MRLSTFIDSNIEEILSEWDKFAKTLFPPEDKGKAYLLRDHAREVLLELTKDMETAQSPQQQAEKSKGVASPYHPDDSAANVHGVMRHDDGFTVSQVAAEFRALRASVLRLWLPKISVMSAEVVFEIIRFNESIDEALADSIVTYKG